MALNNNQSRQQDTLRRASVSANAVEASETSGGDVISETSAKSKTFYTRTESGKKLRVTFREAGRTESQSTEDSTTSQATVIEHPPGAAGAAEPPKTPMANKPTNEMIFEKLKQELLRGAAQVSGDLSAAAAAALAASGQPRVTVLRRGSATPGMILTRSMSTATDPGATQTTTTITTSTTAPVVKTVSFASSVTGGDVVAKEVKVAYQHKRQSSLTGTESTTTPAVVENKPIMAAEKAAVKPARSNSPVVQPQLPAPQPQAQPASPAVQRTGSLPELDGMPSIMKQLIVHFLTCNSDSQQADLAGKMAAILEQAWNRGGARGVEIAEAMCRDVRQDGALALAFALASSNTTNLRELRLNTFRLLVSSFSNENRVWFVTHVKEAGKLKLSQKGGKNPSDAKEVGDLGQLFGHAAATLRTASSAGEFDPELCLAGFGIVRSLMAHSNEACCTALDNGVLEAVALGLRMLPSVLSSSPSTELNQIQSTLSASIATMTTLLQSVVHHQQIVNQANAVDRLILPICNADDNPVAQYFALLSAVSFYRFNGSEDDTLLAAAASSRFGNDDRALRASMAAFLTKAGNSPSSFPFAACSLLVRRGPMSISVKPETWLKRFLDTAVATSAGKVGFAPEVQGMALFHIAVEMERVLGTGLVDDFVRSNQFLQPLLEIAESPNHLANRLAASILQKIAQLNQKVINVQRLSNRVPQWTVQEVRRWLTACVGLVLDEEAKNATEFLDGDLLLTMPFAELKQALFHHASNKAKLALFSRHLSHLKIMADYSAFDSSDVDGFLTRIEPKLRQYTYSFLNAGVDRHFVVNGQLEESMLNTDCGVTNSVHRQQILTAANCVAAIPRENSTRAAGGSKHAESPKVQKRSHRWLYDIFICYKRASGSQLASLLKVYLEMRGFRVFLDVVDLSSGLCYDRLVETISASRHFLLVLTGGSLDGTLGDEDRRDWVHREIYAALHANCNIIPVADNFFTWPSSPSALPADIRSICSLNTIKWLHDYQDACVDKIEKFITDHVNLDDVPAIEVKNFSEDEGMPRQPVASGARPDSALSPKPTSKRPNSPAHPSQRGIAASGPADHGGRNNSTIHSPHNPPNLHSHHVNKTN